MRPGFEPRSAPTTNTKTPTRLSWGFFLGARACCPVFLRVHAETCGPRPPHHQACSASGSLSSDLFSLHPSRPEMGRSPQDPLAGVNKINDLQVDESIGFFLTLATTRKSQPTCGRSQLVFPIPGPDLEAIHSKISTSQKIPMEVSRPVVAFALLRQCSEMMKTDLLSGVSVLIRPLVSDLADQLFDSRVLAERLATAYGLSIPAAALEDMTQRLVSANILRIEQLPSGLTRAVYTKGDEGSLITPEAEKDFQEILDDFLLHARPLLAATGRELSDDILTKEFLHHLATLDFLAIKVKPQVAADDAKKIVGPAAREKVAMSAELADQAAIDSLVASYISWLQEHQPERLNLLAKVADGALAAELVFDLQAPTAVSKLTSTTIVVDSPLILSFLDLSSSQDTIDARRLFDQIRETGAKIAAYQHSIDEAEGVLRATQNARIGGDAYGPSVHRLSNSMFRAYFESMIGSVARTWTQFHHLEIIQEAATHYHQNFSLLEEEELTADIRLSAVDRVLTRERDAKSIAETMRRLGGAHIPVGNIASCRFIFTTSNAALQRRVSSFLHRKNFVRNGEFNPIVTSRYLSGLCWILCGGKTDQSPTTAKLLANCAAALRLKPEIADRTKRFLAAIDPEKAKHFEALMTNERAAQYLTEVTLGDMNVVTANNAEEIFEEVQRRAAEKVAIEKDQHYLGQISALKGAPSAHPIATACPKPSQTG